MRAALIDALGFGVLEVDDTWRVGYANHMSRAVFAAADAIRLVDGRIEFRRGLERERADRWLKQARLTNANDPLALPRSTGRVPYVLYKFSADGLPEEGAEAWQLLLLLDPSQSPAIGAEALMQVFELTRTEAKLASALAGGLSLQTFAEKADMAPGTARRHLERIFLKTGVDRQAELVRLALACALPVRRPSL